MISLLRRKNKPSTTPAKNEGLVQRLVRSVLIGLNLLCLAPVALVALAPYVTPVNWSLPALLALGAPYIALVPVVWLVVWNWRNKRYALLNVVFLLLNVDKLLATVQFNSPIKTTTRDFVVLSYNVNAFSYDSTRVKQVLPFLAEQQPDIVCLIEFYDVKDGRGKKASQLIRKELGLEHYALIPMVENKRFGFAIFSRYPILDHKPVTQVTDTTRNGVGYASIKLFGDTLRLYAMHLESYNFNDKAREPLPDDPEVLQSKADILQNTWVEQIDQLHQFYAFEPVPPPQTVICADLNNVPYSYIYRWVCGDLQDAYRARGSGRGLTYGSGLFGLRIDYQFYGDAYAIVSFALPDVPYSDHLPIVSRVRFRQ